MSGAGEAKARRARRDANEMFARRRDGALHDDRSEGEWAGAVDMAGTYVGRRPMRPRA
jgi:hypothetical protein